MIDVIDGDNFKILYSISSDDESVEMEVSLLLKKYSEVEIDNDGDIVCYE